MGVSCPYLCGVLFASLPDNGGSWFSPFEVLVQGVGGQSGSLTTLYVQQKCLRRVLMLYKRVYCLTVDSKLATAVRDSRRPAWGFKETPVRTRVNTISVRGRQNLRLGMGRKLGILLSEVVHDGRCASSVDMIKTLPSYSGDYLLSNWYLCQSTRLLADSAQRYSPFLRLDGSQAAKLRQDQWQRACGPPLRPRAGEVRSGDICCDKRDNFCIGNQRSQSVWCASVQSLTTWFLETAIETV